MDKKKIISLSRQKETHTQTHARTNERAAQREHKKRPAQRLNRAKELDDDSFERAFVCLRAASRLLFVCCFGRGYFSTLLEEFASSVLFCVRVCVPDFWEKLERRTRGIPIRLPFSSSSTETNSKRAVNLLRVYSPEESVDRD